VLGFLSGRHRRCAQSAALRDKRYVAAAVEHNETWKAWLTEHIGKTGLRVDDSVGNFILIHFPVDGAHTAKAADAFLNARGLSLRGVANYGLPQCLRLTIGTEDANRRVAEALTEFMSAGS
jgi:histidinol-phosphate aminotransferase